MHLSRNNWFTSNSFCLRMVFIVSRGISPSITIWRCFNLFWKNSAIQISPSDILSGLYVSRLFVPQFITTYLSDCGKGILLDLHIPFWVLSPTIPQFMVSLLKFLSQTFLYLIKPAAMEPPLTTVDVLLFAFRSAACLLCFSRQPLLWNLPVG